MNVLSPINVQQSTVVPRVPAAPRGLTPANLMLVGGGHHPPRAYLPWIPKLREAGFRVDVPVVVDLEAARDAVTARLAKFRDISPEFLGLRPRHSGVLDPESEIRLLRAIDAHGINGLIVATNPEEHRPYVDFALRHGISALTDKPVTSRWGAVYDLEAARGIALDYQHLNRQYRRALAEGKRVAAMVNVQRRWHDAVLLMRNQIAQVRDATGQPVTFMRLSHGDGSKRLPGEWITQQYHGGLPGNGKVSHSGYHLLDAMYFLGSASWLPNTRPTSARVISSFVQPGALLRAHPRSYYEAQHGADAYQELCPFSDDEIERVADRLGEVDATIMIELLRDEKRVCSVTINLLHHTPSARQTSRLADDMYKAAGRMKTESWHIVQGHDQDLTLTTIQAQDKHDQPGVKGHKIGEPNHLELTCRRGSEVADLGLPFEVKHGAELGDHDPERLQMEHAKAAALREFVEFIAGVRSHDELRSDLRDHRVPAELMSAAYVSHVLRQRRRGAGGWVTVKI